MTDPARQQGLASRLWHWMAAPMTAGAKRAAITLFILSLALAAVNLLFTAREVNAARSATASVVQLCQFGNEARAQQVGLWSYVASISPPPPHETAAERRARLALVQRFLAHVRQVFAPRDCAAKLGQGR